MRNIFLEKSHTKCAEETFPKPFSKNSKLSISRDQLSKVLWGLLLLYAKISKNIFQNTLKLSCKPLTFTPCKAFLKNKKRSGTSLLATFSALFCYILLLDQICFVRYWTICVLQLFLKQIVTS